MVDKVNTICIPVLRDDLVERCLETLYANTEPNFYVIIVDQTYDGLDVKHFRDKFPDLMIIRTPITERHSTGNLGFAKCFNIGLELCQTEYYTTCNDDIEFINKGWWQGILDTFDKVDKATPDKPCILVTPSSVKLPDWSVGRPKGDDFYIMEYKKEYTEGDWNFLVNEDHYVNKHLTIKPDTVIDGITLYCGIGKTKLLKDIGGLDERFSAGGEDYDFCCRANMMGYRSVGTTLSWVFHHWSMTFRSIEDEEKIRRLVPDGFRWNNLTEIWGPDRHDIWGWKCSICGKTMEYDKSSKKAFCSCTPDKFESLPEVVRVDL
jgi:GT2 family glycosyltransferase